MANQKIALIKGVKTEFDLAGETADTYKDYGRPLKHLGVGTIISNMKGPVQSKKSWNFFKFEN